MTSLMIRSKLFITFCLLTAVLLSSCGHRKSATGGKVDDVKPEIVSINPFELESIASGKIEITFSKPIDRNTILSGIYIYPPIIKKKFKWDGNTLIIIILEDLDENTNYFFSFTSKIEGEHGNKLAADYLYIFKNGKLNENRISGRINYEIGEDFGKEIKLILQSADSTFVFSRSINGNSYELDYLNKDRYILKAYIDNNKNNKYDYGSDPYFYTDISPSEIQTIDLEMAYQDTIKPEILSAKVGSSTQISIELSEPCSSFKNIVLQTADSLTTELKSFASSLIDMDLKIICEPLDTLQYNVVLYDLKDIKGNVKQETYILINGITIQDSIPPTIIASKPRNGATLNTLIPEFEIVFSEIVYSSDMLVTLISNEDKTNVEVDILKGDSEIFTLKPAEELMNYSTYTLTVTAEDPNGNKLEDDLLLTFIPITQ